MAQIDIWLSEPFRIIRFKQIIYKPNKFRANYRIPKYSKIDIQTIFGDEFYTNAIEQNLGQTARTIRIASENHKYQLKSTQVFPRNSKNQVSPQEFNHLLQCQLRSAPPTLAQERDLQYNTKLEMLTEEPTTPSPK